MASQLSVNLLTAIAEYKNMNSEDIFRCYVMEKALQSLNVTQAKRGRKKVSE